MNTHLTPVIMAIIFSQSASTLPCLAEDAFPAAEIKLVDSKEVTLRGVINVITVPVPDGAGLGKPTQSGYFLITPYALVAEGESPGPERKMIRLEGQMLFHLVVQQEIEAKLDKLKGQPVDVVATPFPAHTRYHRTPFLLNVKSIRALAQSLPK